MSVQHMSSAASSGMFGQVDIPDSPVGYLCRDVPLWVSNPPIESVVFAWGASEDHQLGLDTEQDIYQPKVVESLLGIRFMGRSFGSCPLVGGSRNMLALDADGGVWSWGWNDRGTLGHGHRALQRKPAPVQGLANVEVIQAAIGGWHCLALDADGQVYCWGGNEYQQCGWVAPEGDESPGDAARQGQLGADGTRAELRWPRCVTGGGNGGAHGVLPNVRDILVPRVCMPGLKVKQVACGGMNSVVLTDTGEVWTWGEPWGDFAIDTQRAPRKVDGAVNIAAIACGGFHNLALVADGSVLSWGTNDHGQLGNGSTIYSTTPVEVCDLEDVAVADIAAGGWHSMALTADGQIYVWGRGEYGRLGIGDRTGSSKLRPHKIRGLEEHVVVQVAAGGTHSCCVTSSGRMFIWGRASYGRLGLGRDARDMYAPVEVQLPGGHQRWKIAAATAGGRHTMCLAVPVRMDGIKGNSIYGGSSKGSRAASVVNEPVNGAAGMNSRANGSSSNLAAAAAPANGGVGGGNQAGGSSRQQQQQQQDPQQQQQQQQGRVYDPFVTQQQQMLQGGSSSGGGGRSTTPPGTSPADDKASPSDSGGGGGTTAAAAAGAGAAEEGPAAGAGTASGSRGLSAVGVSSPYQPGGALPHGPTLSMQSSYSLVTSPGSSILGGSSPPGLFPTAGPGSLAGTGGPWLGPVLRAEAAAVTAAGSRAGSAGATTAATGEGNGSAMGEAGVRRGNGSPPRSLRIGGGAAAGSSAGGAAAAAVSPRGVSSNLSGGGAAAGVGSAAAAAGRSSTNPSPPPETLPLGVEAVHAATEAAVQQVSALRLHGLLGPGTSPTGNGLQAMLVSHGPLAAAAAAAAGSGGLKAGQGSGVSPRGMPPPMSPSQRAVGLDMGSALREFANTGDQYDVSGRGDSVQWQHQDVSLQLQAGELMFEDDAIQQELQEEQQREADEAALEAAEEQQEEEVRLRRQEHQAQLREAQLRQRQQQIDGTGPGSGPQQGGSYTGLAFTGPGSSGSNSGRPGSSHGRPSFAAAAGAMQHMRRSHSHQQLTDPLAVVAAAAGMDMSSPQEGYALQRYGSNPHTDLMSVHQQQQRGGGSGGGGAGAAAAVGSRAPSVPVNMPSFSAGMGGVRRMTGVNRVDSDASQDLAGLEGGSPADSPSNSATQGNGSRHAGSASAEAGGHDSMRASRGSVGSISGDSSSGQVELGASPPGSGRYDVGLGERYVVGSLPGREQLHHLAHT